MEVLWHATALERESCAPSCNLWVRGSAELASLAITTGERHYHHNPDSGLPRGFLVIAVPADLFA